MKKSPTKSCGCLQKEKAKSVGLATISQNSHRQIQRNMIYNTNMLYTNILLTLALPVMEERLPDGTRSVGRRLFWLWASFRSAGSAWPCFVKPLFSQAHRHSRSSWALITLKQEGTRRYRWPLFPLPCFIISGVFVLLCWRPCCRFSFLLLLFNFLACIEV